MEGRERSFTILRPHPPSLSALVLPELQADS